MTTNPFRSPARWAGIAILPLVTIFAVSVSMVTGGYQVYTPEPGSVRTVTESGWDR